MSQNTNNEIDIIDIIDFFSHFMSHMLAKIEANLQVSKELLHISIRSWPSTYLMNKKK